jgi:protein-S-isoprenylcysteine O-methyltransferase Ste14
MIFACSFALYGLDHENVTAAFANWLEMKQHVDAESVARLVFALAAVILAAAALLRTWASAYLHAGVVYASEIKTEQLVADGPYRLVRNPLYFANILLALGMGLLMSRAGFVVSLVSMVVFCYRLFGREESELAASQGPSYALYCSRVPRLWPSLRPRVPASGRTPQWADGFKAEFWYWGFVIAAAVFAVTLNANLLLICIGASVALLWLKSRLIRPKSDSSER